jgi:hypothetical protein
MFLKSELQFIHKILKEGGAAYDDKQMIFLLYKKYIDPTIVTFDASACTSCGSSLNRMWHEIKDYILSNADKFVN